MNLLSLTYNEVEKKYSYFISPAAPSNCKILDFKNFSEINIRNNFILFIGNVWHGPDIGMSNTLGEIAFDYLEVTFYFKLILEEEELENVLPNVISSTKLPLILYINYYDFSVVSTGSTSKEQLNSKINELFRITL